MRALAGRAMTDGAGQFPGGGGGRAGNGAQEPLPGAEVEPLSGTEGGRLLDKEEGHEGAE